MAETVSNELILSSAPPAKAGAASAVSETAYELGAVLGTTVLGGILTALYRANLVAPRRASGCRGSRRRAARRWPVRCTPPTRSAGRSGEALRDAAAHAFDAGVDVTALIGAALVVVAAVIAATTLGGSARATTRCAAGAAMSRVVKLAVIPGDGIGPEVIAEAEKVLDAATAGSGIRFEKTRFSLGAARFLETGDTLTDADLDAIKGHDAILLGAVGGVPGDPRLKDANIERGLLLKLRFELDHYVNLRPSKLYPGVPGSAGGAGRDRLRRRPRGHRGAVRRQRRIDPHAARRTRSRTRRR